MSTPSLLTASAADMLLRLEDSARRFDTDIMQCRIVWRAWGRGPALVLLHGGHGSWRHWVRNIDALSAHYTLLLPDLPGLGDSADLTGEAPQAVAGPLAAALPVALARLGLGPSCHLVGFSFGALIAGLMALELAPVLRSLILLGPGALGLPRGRVELRNPDEVDDAQERLAVHRDNLASLMIADPDRIDALALEIQVQNMAQARLRSRRIATSSLLAEALLTLRLPGVHAIWGEHDAVALPYMEARRQFMQALGAGFHVLPDAGHWAQYENSEGFNALLRRLLAQIEAPG